MMPIMRPKHVACIEAELLRDGFASFNHQHYVKLGMIVRERVSCSPPAQEDNEFVILELGDDEPLLDVGTRNGTAGAGMAPDMLVGKDEDANLISLCVDRRCF
jgi:hypothetical protein